MFSQLLLKPNATSVNRNQKASDKEKDTTSASTTLERSLASIHEKTESQLANEPVKASKKKPKKRSKKSPLMEEDDGEEWLPVTSKKEKLQKYSEQRAPQSTTTVPASAEQVPETSTQKKKKKNDKPKSEAQSVLVETSLIGPPVCLIPSSTSANPEVSQSSSVSGQTASRPQRAKHSRRKSNSVRIDEENIPSVLTVSDKNYTSELEHLVVECLGSEAVVNVRMHFPSLTFQTPPPISSENNSTGLSTELVQMKAYLQSKEAECQVLRDEVVKMHKDIISLKTAALTSQAAAALAALPKVAATPPDAAPAIKEKNMHPTCCKTVQCDILVATASAPTPDPVESRTVTPPPSTPANSPFPYSTDIVFQTLQSEIANLAKAKTLLEQRNQNLDVRLKESVKRVKALQLSAKRTAAESKAAAESAVAERVAQMESDLAAAQADVVRLQLAEQTSQSTAQELHRVMSEYEKLLESNNALQQEMSVCTQQLGDFQHQLSESKSLLETMEQERATLSQNELIASQKLADAQSQLARISSVVDTDAQHTAELQNKVSQLEVEVEANRRLASQSKEEVLALQAETQRLQELFNESEQLKAVLQAELEQKSAQIKELEQLKGDLQTELEQKCTQIKEIEQFKGALQSELEEKYTQMKELESLLKSATERAEEAETAKATAISSAVTEMPSSVEEQPIEKSCPIASVAAEPPIASSSPSEPCSNCAELVGQVEHYKGIMNDTEIALSKLQQSVDQEEEHWRKSIRDCVTENANLKEKMNALTAEVSTLTSHLTQAQRDLDKFHSAAKFPAGNGHISPVVANGNGTSVGNGHCFSENEEETELVDGTA